MCQTHETVCCCFSKIGSIHNGCLTLGAFYPFSVKLEPSSRGFHICSFLWPLFFSYFLHLFPFSSHVFGGFAAFFSANNLFSYFLSVSLLFSQSISTACICLLYKWSWYSTLRDCRCFWLVVRMHPSSVGLNRETYSNENVICLTDIGR